MTEPPEGAAPPPPPPPPAGDASGGYWAPPAPPLDGPPYAASPGLQPQYGAGDTYLDPQSGLVLPTGVQLASHGRRVGAYFLSIVLVIVTLGIGFVIWGLILWPQGQTPAFKVLGMRCWRPESREVPGFWWMALREIVGRFVDGILSFISALVSFILFLSTKERKSLHDYVAGTVVLYDPDGRLGR